MFRSRAGRLPLAGALLVLLSVCPGPAGGQESKLTPEERKRLESEAGRLGREALAQFGRGDYKAALRSLEQTLATKQRLHAKQDHPDLVNTLNGLGVVWWKLGQADRAVPYLERALAMQERLSPRQDHPDLALSLNNLGVTLEALGRPDKALPYLERALAMRERLYPK